MSTAFTKGPWQVKHSESKSAFNVVGASIGWKYKIARCPYEDSDRDKKEAEANARLIAAAPDMFESLTTAVTFLKNNGFYAHPAYKKYIAIAEAAIAKASGKKEDAQ